MTNSFKTLEARAFAVRNHVLGLSAKGGCFVGAAFSCVEILVYLYDGLVGPPRDDSVDFNRDYVILSKGHAVSALYGLLVERGSLDCLRLEDHLSSRDLIYWHPNASIPGVDFATGSLGHGLAVGVGIALQLRNRGSHHRVFVVLGDGELNEGSVWEALMVAHAQDLGNLTLIIDRNGFQANARTEDLSRLEPLADKLAAFGCRVVQANGHAFEELAAALECKNSDPRPLAVIAKTIRGRGLRAWEGDWEKWFVQITSAELPALREQLERVCS